MGAHNKELLLGRLRRGAPVDADKTTIFGVSVSEMDEEETKAALLWAIGTIQRQADRLTETNPLNYPGRRW